MKTANKQITSEKENGRIYTPEYIVNTILDLSGYYGPQILKKHVIDNSCGDGAFLCEIVERYCTMAKEKLMDVRELKEDLQQFIHGIEIEREEQEKCLQRVSAVAATYGVYDLSWDIRCADTLTIREFDGKMDYVLGNPPYVRVHNLSSPLEDVKKFSFAQGGMTDLFIVFYEIGIRMLSSTGVLGYITPSSFFNSVAGSYMRNVFVQDSLLAKLVDLKHYQAFNATTYTTIVVLQKNKNDNEVDYYYFDEESKRPVFADTLTPDDYYVGDNFFFAEKSRLQLLKKIYSNYGKCDIMVKNGYATLCDGVFIGDFDFESPHILPVIKSSKGKMQQIIYPYDSKGKLIPEDILRQDEQLYLYLLSKKELLLKRSNEKDAEQYWYAFGRSQAILDTYRDKLAINSLLRDEHDFKFVEAPAGVGVYGGLYIVSDTISMAEIMSVLKTSEFATYVALLSKYKSGGYYTFSSKDVKAYLDFKFAYDGGLLSC
jgi:adenine-specific DNA-methyltransferase